MDGPQGRVTPPFVDGACDRQIGLVTKKKSLVASEKDRPDVVERIREFKRAILDLTSSRLIFIDETGVNLAMTPTRARAPVGERAVCKRPAARGTNVSVVGALSADGIVAFDAKDGAYDGERFLLFLESKLIPKLRPGDVVLMDNVRFHRIAAVPALIEATGARVLYLPPYSPELNPIEEAWSVFKHRMRLASARTLLDLVDALISSMAAITSNLAQAFIKHAGYAQLT